MGTIKLKLYVKDKTRCNWTLKTNLGEHRYLWHEESDKRRTVLGFPKRGTHIFNDIQPAYKIRTLIHLHIRPLSWSNEYHYTNDNNKKMKAQYKQICVIYVTLVRNLYTDKNN